MSKNPNFLAKNKLTSSSFEALTMVGVNDPEPYNVLHEKHGINTTFLTFGNSDDLIYTENLQNVNIIPIYENINILDQN